MGFLFLIVGPWIQLAWFGPPASPSGLQSGSLALGLSLSKNAVRGLRAHAPVSYISEPRAFYFRAVRRHGTREADGIGNVAFFASRILTQES